MNFESSWEGLGRVLASPTADQLRGWLSALSRHVSGVSPSLIDEIISSVSPPLLDEDPLFELEVQADGEAAPLLLQIFPSEIDALDVVFITTSAVCDLVRQTCPISNKWFPGSSTIQQQ